MGEEKPRDRIEAGMIDERIKRIDFSDCVAGDIILFCADCDFQIKNAAITAANSRTTPMPSLSGRDFT